MRERRRAIVFTYCQRRRFSASDMVVEERCYCLDIPFPRDRYSMKMLQGDVVADNNDSRTTK